MSTSFTGTVTQASVSEIRIDRVKAEPSFMQRRQLFNVIIDNEDLTPDNIVDPNFAVMTEWFKHAAFDNTLRNRDEANLKQAMSRSKSIAASDNFDVKVFATTINLDDVHIDHSLNTEEELLDYDLDLEQAPSAYCLPKVLPVTSYPPEINITLKETDTCYLFELPSQSFDKGTSAAKDVEEDNVYYEYMTVGKGKNRKMCIAETQTESIPTQSRHTLAVRPKKKNVGAFASMWDMHDTYERLARETVPPKPDEMVLFQSAAPSRLRKKKVSVAFSQKIESKTFKTIASTPEFLDAALITERVLASLKYSEAQKIFRGLIKMNPLSLDLVYIYTMKPLWVYECPETANKPVICVSFSPKNKDILAVAHGKYAYAEESEGMVCVWCSKNPCKPERLYRFDCPVTSVSFSEKNPNWLACGFWNGDVIILDVTSYTIKIVSTSSRVTNPSFDPIWVTEWRTMDGDTEYVMTGCQDGRINKFSNTKTGEFVCTLMMRVAAVDGKLKGLETPKTCLKMDVPITRHPGVLCMIWHAEINHIYFVGTDEGCVHKCSTHYLNQHIDVFRAHAGPVYDVIRSSFRDDLYVTSGADNAVRLWIAEVDEMIMTLPCVGAVHGVALCPKNATIIITISENVMSVWDIRLKTHIPCAEYKFAANVVLRYVHFSRNGDNAYVGDTLGRVHTFHMEDTPIEPFDQRKILDQAIKTALCTRPQLLKQLEKIEAARLVKKNRTSSAVVNPPSEDFSMNGPDRSEKY